MFFIYFFITQKNVKAILLLMVFTYFFPPSFPLTQQHLVIFNCVLFLLAHFQVGKKLFKSIIFYVHTFGVLMALTIQLLSCCVLVKSFPLICYCYLMLWLNIHIAHLSTNLACDDSFS